MEKRQIREMTSDNHDHPYERDEVVRIIDSVIEKVRAGEDVSRSAIFRELEDLKKLIEDARREISAVGAGDIQDKHIPTATDELDAVIGATEEATGIIMDSCEAIQKQMSQMEAAAVAAIEAAVTRIFEACSFQDITGQRITKVVKTLKQIEEKVSSVLGVLGKGMPGSVGAPLLPAVPGCAATPVSLLNGPQMPDKAARQEEIDRILAEFDARQ